jgi:hypothetical protein
MKRVGAVVVSLVAICNMSCRPTPTGDERQTLLLFESLVRYAVQHVPSPCVNHGRKDVWCLAAPDEKDPPPFLLNRLSDVRPAIRTLSACKRDGVVNPSANGTLDPTVRIESVQMAVDGSVKARVRVFCFTVSLTAVREADNWQVRSNAMVGCGPLPGDCRFK